MPEVSVIVALHNQGRYLGKCLQSALGQDFGDLEVIVVDDASTDGSLEVARELANQDPQRVRIFANERNLGVSGTRNHGAYRAKGDILAFLDADDYWLPGKLERQMAAFRADPELGMCHTGVKVVDGSTNAGEDLEDLSHPLSSWATSFNSFCEYAAGFGARDYFRHLLMANNICLSSVAVRKSAFRRAGGFVDVGGCQCEDWLLWLKLSVLTVLKTIPDRLAAYRFHPDSHTARVLMNLDFDYASVREAVIQAAMRFDPARVGAMLEACRPS